MYSKANEGKLISEIPGFALFKEHGRSLRLNDEAERRLSAVAEQPLKDIILVMRDTGMRNARELYCMRVENVDFDAGTIFTPDSKTESGRRFIPMSSRVKQILEARCAGRSEGWLWMSRYKGKHIGEGMVVCHEHERELVMLYQRWEMASRSRLAGAGFKLPRCCCVRKSVVVNDCGKGAHVECQVSVEEMSESKPSDDASLLPQGAVETGAAPLLQDESGRHLFTDPVAAGVKAA